MLLQFPGGEIDILNLILQVLGRPETAQADLDTVCRPRSIFEVSNQAVNVRIDIVRVLRIEQHVPHWLPVEDGERTRLGFARQRPERIGRELPRLGRNTSAGNKAWDRQYRFRVVLGPLTLRQYEGFLPDGDAWRPLNDWIRQYVGHNLQWELQPVLRRDEVPAAALSGSARLGFTSWTGRSGGRPHRHDRGDLHLHPQQRVKGRATPPASQGASS